MKRIFAISLLLVFSFAFLAGCSGTDNPGQSKGGREEFTALYRNEYESIEFCLPENHEGNLFTDMGANCMVEANCYSNPVVAYYEYDKESPIEKKTVGKYTFDYQKFNYLGISNWRMYVIKIAFTDDPNQMVHRYYRIVYNVYSEDYDDAQVEKFMSTINFLE